MDKSGSQSLNRIGYAADQVLGALGGVQTAAAWLDRIIAEDAGHAEQLVSISAQLWQMTGTIREHEASLAEIRTAMRNAEGGDLA